MLRWGIPGYRLPESVLDAEIQKILDLGVELKCGVKVGKDVSLDELQQSYDAVYVALGAQQGVSLGVEGEDAPNVFAGVDFLNRFHHGEKLDLGKDVVVIVVGGGDTAIDAARICKRLGANVTILYRRTIEEMPAIGEEVEEAMEEGIKIEFLAAPVGFKREGNRVTAMRCIRMELGEPDASGRRRPVPIEGSEFEIPATRGHLRHQPGARLQRLRVADRGQGLDRGRRARRHESRRHLGRRRRGATRPGHHRHRPRPAGGRGDRAQVPRQRRPRTMRCRSSAPTACGWITTRRRSARSRPSLAVDQRLGGVDVEVNLGLTAEQVIEETRRCMSCGYCFDCEKCWLFCQDQAVDKPMQKGVLYTFKLENCTGCKKCAEECPCGFIDML